MDFAHVEKLLMNKQYQELKKYLANIQIADIAEFLDQLDLKTALLVFRLLPKDEAAAVFAYLSPLRQTELSKLVNENELQQIINDLFFDDKIDFLEEMPASVVKSIILIWKEFATLPPTKKLFMSVTLSMPAVISRGLFLYVIW